MTLFESGDKVACTIGTGELKGTFITERDGMAVIKLESGYNIGVGYDSCDLIEHVDIKPSNGSDIVQNEKLPLISIISTGGTIASRIDYRTGAVTSQFEAKDILTAIPELTTIAKYRAVQLRNILSENMTPAIWQELSQAIYDEIKAGAKGIIVTHGTDTMAYSAAAVSFMLRTPVPVVFVGSQRSADRPSSDNVMNGLCAAKTAVEGPAEVVVVMHETTSDERCAVHRGTRVRKMHSSCRNAFQSLGAAPLGYVSYPSLEMSMDLNPDTEVPEEPKLYKKLEEKCGLIHYHPGMSPDVLEPYRYYKGLVIAGTGLGHVGTAWIEKVNEMIVSGVLIVMTTQCLSGKVCDRVYDTGRDLLRIGVIEGRDMLPEVALVKLMWVLANSENRSEAESMMETNLVGEITGRSQYGL